MIIKGFRNLAELENRLRAIPPEKLKSIVLVGKHPNEGMIGVAKLHHEAWEKEHGAFVVQVPGKWTPYGIWRRVWRRLTPLEKAGTLTADSRARILEQLERYSKVSQDERIIDFLREKGFDLPAVNFHGNLLTNAMAVPSIDFEIASADSRIVPFHRVTQTGKPPMRPNEVVVEYWCSSKTAKPTAVSRFAESLALTNEEEQKIGQLSPGYLHEHGAATKSALQTFTEDHAREFARGLKHLAETCLKKAK